MIRQIIPPGSLLVVIIFLSFTLGGEGIGWVSNLNALMLVLGGAFCYALMTYPREKLFLTARLVIKSFSPPDNIKDMIQTIGHLARLYQGGWGIRNLERKVKELSPGLLRMGVESIAYQYERDKIKQVLEKEASCLRGQYESAGKVLSDLSQMLISMGLIGTLIYFVRFFHAAQDIHELLGFSAGAFLSTFYGILFGKLGLNPLLGKVKDFMAEEDFRMELVQEGVLAISDLEHPRVIRFRLENHSMARAATNQPPREPEVVLLSKEVVLDRRIEPVLHR
ncbi:MAG: MotA/TolQ/ExbB proton channel family protein [Syntrophaceae bacterium]|nr:MotA/TolQ/ExbB proton channel family protein [Syntrophaceae bacterium]